MSLYQTRGVRFRPWLLPRQQTESEVVLKARRHKAYFDWQFDEIVPGWWQKLPPVDLSNCSVLDIGCGHGALAIDVLKRGASRVVGLDLDQERIQFARGNVERDFTTLADKAAFYAQRLEDLDDKFDVVMSKDAFEHIDDLEAMMSDIARVLKPGGRLIVGFGPLYYSPYGDHGLLSGGTRMLPWIHAFLPEKLLLAITRWRTGESWYTIDDLGLNKLTPAQFRKILSKQSWTIESLAYNKGDRALHKVCAMMRKIPFVERFFTIGIYAVLTKK